MGAFDQQALANFLLAPTPAPMGLPSDKGDLKDLGSRLTQMSKWGNLTTDLDFLTTMGMVPAGAYDPMTSYEDVDAPWFRQSQIMQKGSPYEQWLAKKIDLGATSGEVQTELQTMVTNPGGGVGGLGANDVAAILGSVPRLQVEDGGRGSGIWVPDPENRPDIMRAVNDFERYQTIKLAEPQYEIVDGRPVKTITEESPATEAWYEAGHSSDPTATYDPYSFAPQGVTAETDARRVQRHEDLLGDVQSDWDAGQGVNAKAQAANKLLRDAMMGFARKRPEEQFKPEELSGTFSGGALNPNNQPVPNKPPESPDMSFPNGINPNNLPINDDGSIGNGQGAPMMDDPGRRARSSGGGGSNMFDRDAMGRSMVESLLGANARTRGIDVRKAREQLLRTRDRARDASNAAALARHDAAMRQAYVERLRQAGYSPAQDEVRARSAMVLGS